MYKISENLTLDTSDVSISDFFLYIHIGSIRIMVLCKFEYGLCKPLNGILYNHLTHTMVFASELRTVKSKQPTTMFARLSLFRLIMPHAQQTTQSERRTGVCLNIPWIANLATNPTKGTSNELTYISIARATGKNRCD